MRILFTGTAFHWLYKTYVAKAKLFDIEKPNEQEMYIRYMSKALQFLKMTEEIMVIGKPFMQMDIELRGK